MQYSRWGLTRAEQRGTITSLKQADMPECSSFMYYFIILFLSFRLKIKQRKKIKIISLSTISIQIYIVIRLFHNSSIIPGHDNLLVFFILLHFQWLFLHTDSVFAFRVLKSKVRPEVCSFLFRLLLHFIYMQTNQRKGLLNKTNSLL